MTRLRRTPVGPSQCVTCGSGLSQEGARRPRLYCSRQCREGRQTTRRKQGIAPRPYRRRDDLPKGLSREEYMAAYAVTRKAEIRGQQRAAYAALPERRGRIHAYGKAWAAANRETVRSHRIVNEGRRRARKRQAGVLRVTDSDIARLAGRHSGRCAYCVTRPWEHLDHVIPIARGGRHSIGNLLPACQPCNQSKNSRLLAEWRYLGGCGR